jgi:glycosyltransferase involved in cell wall biosynthesis
MALSESNIPPIPVTKPESKAEPLPGGELLAGYRMAVARELGVPIPLMTVPAPPGGLLAELPKAPEGKTGWPWTVESPVRKLSGVVPKITVVTPSFGHAAFLEETIRSVLLQNYPNTEYVVMDGGSKDGTKEILEKYRPWLSAARSAPDRGQGNAINLGFSIGSGEIFGWLNSDDYYLPSALSHVCDAFAEPALEFFHSDGLYFLQETGEYRYASGQLALDRYLQFGGIVMSHTAFWRKSVHQAIWEELQCNVDGELWFRVLRGSRRRHLPLPLAVNRNQPDAKTIHPRWRKAWHEDELKIWARHGHPPRGRSPRIYEYRYVQRLYQWWNATRHRQERNESLKPLNLPVEAP